MPVRAGRQGCDVNPEQAARRWQERRVAQSRRDVELETFPTTAGAASLNAHPMFGVGYGQSLRTPQLPEPGLVGGGSLGEVCSLKATSVAVSTTPTVVEFTATVGEQAWASDLTLPTGEIVPTFADSYYDIQVELDRGSFTGEVKVEVLRGDTVVWGPDMSPYWNDPQVPVTAKGRLTQPGSS